MNKTLRNVTKKMAAWLMTLLMLVSQLAMPVAALAAVDTSTLPMVTVNYTQLDGAAGSMPVYASVTGANQDQVVYWAQLPDNTNWEAGVTVIATAMDGCKCLPDGTTP